MIKLVNQNVDNVIILGFLFLIKQELSLSYKCSAKSSFDNCVECNLNDHRSFN